MLKKIKLLFNQKVAKVVLVIVLVISFSCYLVFREPSLNQIEKSVVKINVFDEKDNLIQNGSGFAIFESNYIMTNYHVIEGAHKIEIMTNDQKKYLVEDILIFNRREDIAILTASINLKPLKLAKAMPEEGDEVIAIGSPTGKLNDRTFGIVYTSDIPYRIINSAKIAPGSSGGVLLNDQNQVIAMTTGQFTSNERDDLYFAISAKYIERAQQALFEEDFHLINTYNINFCRDEIDVLLERKEISFSRCNNSNNQFFSPSNLEVFYSLTNKYEIFDNSYNRPFNLVFNNLGNLYNSMSEMSKNNVVDNLDFILNYSYDFHYTSFDFFRENKAIDDWNILEFFMNLQILTPIEFAIVEEDLSLYITRNEKYNRVLNSYNLSTPTSMLILLLMGGNQIYNFSDSDIEELFYYLDKKIYNNQDLATILGSLGYNIEFGFDGTLLVSW